MKYVARESQQKHIFLKIYHDFYAELGTLFPLYYNYLYFVGVFNLCTFL